MTSSFDNLPQEALCRIIECFDESEEDLRQIQLLNKRCQSIAEEYIYRELTLSNFSLPENMIPYLQYVLKPRRGKLVKALVIPEEQEPFFALDDDFFEMFPNIEELRYLGASEALDWEYLSKIFTAERCKLQEIPYLDIRKDNKIEGYTKILCNHHQTLEILCYYCHVGAATISHQILQFINNAQWNFPKLRVIEGLDLAHSKLQDLDTMIDKCPILDDLYMEFVPEQGLSRYIPDSQHQHMMTKVQVFGPYTRFLDFCDYFVTKFPNTQSLILSSRYLDQIKEEDGLSSIDEMIDFWKLNILTRPGETAIKFTTNRSSISKALDFITESYHVNATVDISYCLLDTVNNKSSEAVDIRFERADSGPGIVITYPSISLGHLCLTELIGHYVKDLRLDLSQLVISKVQPESEPSFEKLLFGEIITHTLDNFPLLTSLKVELVFWDYLGSHTVYPNLTAMDIICSSFSSQLLLSLSYQTPNLKVFNITAVFPKNKKLPENQKSIAINMPYSSFNELMITDLNCDLMSEISQQIAVEIVLPTHQSPVRVCFQKRKVTPPGKTTDFYDQIYYFIEQEPNAKLQPARTFIFIRCKSIKCFKFTGKLDEQNQQMFFSKEIAEVK